MKPLTLKLTALAILIGAVVYLGTLVGTAQERPKPDAGGDKLEQVLTKIDGLSKKMDELSEKLEAIQKDVEFIKARGKG
jgi:outer membrane murein-binding lipoprotein Lpp